MLSKKNNNLIYQCLRGENPGSVLGLFVPIFACQRGKWGYFAKKFGEIYLNQGVKRSFQYRFIALNLRHYSLKPTQCSTSFEMRVKQGRGGEVLQKRIDRELNLWV
ncbi:hypothetical protein GMJAKD_08400 [Candidatus Electrothrix aarhusensis]